MAQVTKIDSNVTGLSYAEETSLKTLPGTPIWIPLEPNSYTDFGGEITTVARNPINPSRQRLKGVVTDLDASGGFDTDVTQENLQDLLQGFFFADLLRKGELKNAPGVTTLTVSVTAATDTFTRVGGALDLTTQFAVGDLVKTAGFANAANNGLFKVSAVTATTVVVTQADGADTSAVTVDEAATSNGSIVQVGIEATVAGDIDVDMSGTRPALTSTTLDFTTMGLNVGEWVRIGGDVAATQFGTAANNTFARVRSIAATRLEFDKTQNTMVTEANTTSRIQIFTGRVLKNQTGSLIKRRSYQLERQLGAPDDALPAQIQSEYLTGAIPNELTLTVASADKLTASLSFIAADNEQRTGATGVKAGTRVALGQATAFNTSSDFPLNKLSIYSATDANPTALFGFAPDFSITITNNLTPLKAIGTLGAFEVSAGTFQVSGDITAYFSNVDAVSAVRNNPDVTFESIIVKENAGLAIDLPLVTLGDGRANIEQDAPITLPLTQDAASGSKIDSGFDHTIMMVFFDYLPTAANPST